MAYDVSNFKGPGGVNVAECLRVADLVERSPSFNMGDWAHPCGTPACIAGHIVERDVLLDLLEKRTAWMSAKHLAFGRNYAETVDNLKALAGGVLGIDRNSAQALFAPTMDVQDNCDGHWAAACLRHLAATGEVDWLGTKPA